MRLLKCWLALLLCAVALGVSAEEPYCPPSLDAPLGEGEGQPVSGLPRGHLFQPLIADPKEPRFFLSYRDYDNYAAAKRVGIVGFGETFPLWRRTGECPSDGLQLGIAGGVFARFLMDDPDNNLFDADYSIALPLSWRRGNVSLRARVYHESSHLGESELFNSDEVDRVKKTIDAVGLVGSYDQPTWRIYAGGEYLYLTYPDIDPLMLQGGVEYYGPRHLFGTKARWVSALDVKAFSEFAYSPDYSIKSGLSFGGAHARQHHLQLLLEWYDGHANQGVLFAEELRYLGVGLYFGF
jgi:hypothetical protein